MNTVAVHMGDGELLEPFDFKASQSPLTPKQEDNLEANETSLLSNPGKRSGDSWQMVAEVIGKKELAESPSTGSS